MALDLAHQERVRVAVWVGRCLVSFASVATFVCIQCGQFRWCTIVGALVAVARGLQEAPTNIHVEMFPPEFFNIVYTGAIVPIRSCMHVWEGGARSAKYKNL